MATNTVTNIASGTVPYGDAHESSGLMFDVLTLICAALDHDTDDKNTMEYKGLTSNRSRLDGLLVMAADKTAAAIRKLNV